MARKFISFSTEEEKKEIEKKKNHFKGLLFHKKQILNLSAEFDKVFDDYDFNLDDTKNTLSRMKQEIDKLILHLTITKSQENNPLAPKTILSSVKDVDKNLNDEFEKRIQELNAKSQNLTIYTGPTSSDSRSIPGGGMAPPEVKKITDVDLDYLERVRLVNEMKNMYNLGQTVNPKVVTNKAILSLNDMVEAFEYLESPKDYSGPFMITILKSDNEIDIHAAMGQIDLTSQKIDCIKGKSLILNIYDINGSSFRDEAKRFTLVLKYNDMYGLLSTDKIIFHTDNISKLSERQEEELKKFCTSKKINYEAIR